ncbi:MAG: DUF5317 domain-containing protein [Armatimonadota bacterium]|nr:MAG: DUF5317 domain-containing protein [Armatimonadota bacterium]
MLLDAAVLTIVVGALGGGRLGRLKGLELRAPGVFIVAAAVQIGVMALGARGTPAVASVGGAVQIVTYVLLLVGLWLNRHLWGIRIAAVGVFLNFLVIVANGGSMPVDRELAMRAGNLRLVAMVDSQTYRSHMAATESTRLRPLGDVLSLPMLVPRPRFFSPGSVGDVFVTAGACWLILSGLGAFGLGRRRETAAAGSNSGGSG